MSKVKVTRLPAFGERIAFLRKGLCYEKWGQQLGLGITAVTKWEKEGIPPRTVKALRTVVKMCETSFNWLLGIRHIGMPIFDEPTPTFATKMKALREHNELTQQEMGEILGLEKRTVRDYETNTTEPQIVAIINTCNHFKISADWLLDNSETEVLMLKSDIFGQRIKDLKGKELNGFRLSVGNASLERYISGTWIPSIEIVTEMAIVYNVSADYLLGLKDDKTFFEHEVDFPTIAERLKNQRERVNLSQTEVGEYIGGKKQSVSQYETGRNPGLGKFVALCTMFGVSADYLLGISEESARQKLLPILADRLSNKPRRGKNRMYRKSTLPMPTDSPLSRNMKQLRRDADLSRKKFGEVFGVSEATVGNWEKDRSIPSHAVLCQIAREYNVSLDWLTGNEEKPASDKVKNMLAIVEGILTEHKGEILCSLLEDISAIRGVSKADLELIFDLYARGGDGCLFCVTRKGQQRYVQRIVHMSKENDNDYEAKAIAPLSVPKNKPKNGELYAGELDNKQEKSNLLYKCRKCNTEFTRQLTELDDSPSFQDIDYVIVNSKCVPITAFHECNNGFQGFADFVGVYPQEETVPTTAPSLNIWRIYVVESKYRKNPQRGTAIYCEHLGKRDDKKRSFTFFECPRTALADSLMLLIETRENEHYPNINFVKGTSEIDGYENGKLTYSKLKF